MYFCLQAYTRHADRLADSFLIIDHKFLGQNVQDFLIRRNRYRLGGIDNPVHIQLLNFAVADGDSLYLVGKVLGHTQASTTQRYAHLQLDPVRAVADRTSRRLAGALAGGGAGGNVVKLSGGRQ